jgi:hypothetical protein
VCSDFQPRDTKTEQTYNVKSAVLKEAAQKTAQKMKVIGREIVLRR